MIFHIRFIDGTDGFLVLLNFIIVCDIRLADFFQPNYRSAKDHRLAVTYIPGIYFGNIWQHKTLYIIAIKNI